MLKNTYLFHIGAKRPRETWTNSSATATRRKRLAEIQLNAALPISNAVPVSDWLTVTISDITFTRLKKIRTQRIHAGNHLVKSILCWRESNAAHILC